jgi:hypothetical protein
MHLQFKLTNKCKIILSYLFILREYIKVNFMFDFVFFYIISNNENRNIISNKIDIIKSIVHFLFFL